MAEENDVLVTRTDKIEIDWPQLVGYYGGIGLALAAEIIEPPLALFIGAIPLVKMLKRPGASVPTRVVAQVLEGAAIPVGGEAQSAVRIKQPGEDQRKQQQGRQQQQAQPVTA